MHPTSLASRPRSLRTYAVVTYFALGLGVAGVIGYAALQISAVFLYTGSDEQLALLVDVGSSLTFLAFVAIGGAAFITWLYNARTNLDAFGAYPDWKAGWAIGGWFVPVAGLFISLLVVGEIDRQSQNRLATVTGNSAAEPRRTIFRAWATTWTLYLIADRITATVAAQNLGDNEQIDGLIFANVVTGLLGLCAAAAAIALVRQITAAQERVLEARQPAVPYAAP